MPRPLGVFPEGTTTNGRLLIQFRAGAFRLRCPVQPAFIRHSFCWFSPYWTLTAMPVHVISLLSQVYNDVHITLLPVHVPTAHEMDHPIEFANTVRAKIAEYSGMDVTELTFRHSLAYFHAIQHPRTRTRTRTRTHTRTPSPGRGPSRHHDVRTVVPDPPVSTSARVVPLQEPGPGPAQAQASQQGAGRLSPDVESGRSTVLHAQQGITATKHSSPAPMDEPFIPGSTGVS